MTEFVTIDWVATGWALWWVFMAGLCWVVLKVFLSFPEERKYRSE